MSEPATAPAPGRIHAVCLIADVDVDLSRLQRQLRLLEPYGLTTTLGQTGGSASRLLLVGSSPGRVREAASFFEGSRIFPVLALLDEHAAQSDEPETRSIEEGWSDRLVALSEAPGPHRRGTRAERPYLVSPLRAQPRGPKLESEQR